MVGATVRILLLACAASPVVVALRAGNATTAVRAITAVQDDATLTAEVDEILSKIESAAKEGSSSYLRKPEPEPSTVPYSPVTCRNLFAYKDNRDKCLKLQKTLCVRECSYLFAGNDTVIAECDKLKKKLCYVPLQKPVSSPHVVANGSNATTTFCNAYLSHSDIAVQHDKYYAMTDPEPFVKDLKYMNCKQVAAPPGETVNIYLGNHPMTTHVMGSDNAIVMLGQYNMGELEMGVTVTSFKDNDYKRPVLCSAYPAPQLQVAVAGRDWHPFSDAHHPRSIGYMECEELLLDHADSLYHPEILEFFDNRTHKGDVDINPMNTLFLVGSAHKDATDQDVVGKAFKFDNLASLKARFF